MTGPSEAPAADGPLPADEFRVEPSGFRMWPHGLFLTSLLLILAAASIPLGNVLIYTPERAVKAYLEAIARADAETALGLLGLEADPGATLLQDEVLAGAASLPSAVRVEDTSYSEDAAQVRASFLLDSATHTVTLPVVRADTGWQPYDSWRIAVEALPVLDIEVQGSPTARVNGHPIAVDGDPVQVLFPASYLIDFDSEWLSAQTERLPVLEPGGTAALQMSAEPTEALTAEVDRQIGEFLAQCAQARTLAPGGCPFRHETDDEILGEVDWEIDETPPVRLERSDDSLTMPTGSGFATASGRERDIVTGEERDFRAQVEFFLGAEVRVADGGVLVSPRDASLEQG